MARIKTGKVSWGEPWKQHSTVLGSGAPSSFANLEPPLGMVESTGWDEPHVPPSLDESETYDGLKGTDSLDQRTVA